MVGWPNAPSIPEFSSEGKTVTINWKTPRYLGGLNNSLINYKTYKHNFAGAISLQDSLQENYHCRDTQCNITVEIRHLKNGGMEGFHVSLYIAKPVSMMCQGYNTPHVIASKRSEICFSNILGEYIASTVTVLYCILLLVYCTVLYCTLLYCTVLYYKCVTINV